jgi:hypothetical protein
MEDARKSQAAAPAAAGRSAELEPAHAAATSDEEQGAERAEPEVPTPPTLAELKSLADRLTALEAQLASLETPELERLRAAARRERALTAQHDELAERLARLPAPGRVRRDPRAVERQGLERGSPAPTGSWPDCAPCAHGLNARSVRSTRCSPSAPGCTRRSPPPATTATRSATT